MHTSKAAGDREAIAQMAQHRTGETWLLGATGRIGRAVSQTLPAAHNGTLVLVGRNVERLQAMAATVPTKPRILVAETAADMAEAITTQRPALVVNLVGGYNDCAGALAEACLPGGHYVDLANDPASMTSMLGMNDAAASAGSTFVTSAGFGVLATEALVVALCADRSTPTHVQVDAVGSVATEAGILGEAFAAAIVDSIAHGGRRYRNGELVRIGIGSHVQHLQLPDGDTATTGAVPSGELLAARTATAAPSILATSALVPTSPLVRVLLPFAAGFLRSQTLRRILIRRLAGSRTTARPRPRQHSWGHVLITWDDGTSREGWLRCEDAMDYTAAVITAIAERLAGGDAPAGAFTPAMAFGPGIAEEAGAELIMG